MARTVTAHCCEICGDVLAVRDSAAQPRTLKRIDALRVEVGFSRGGWGHRNLYCEESAKIDFAEEICGDCYDKAQALLRPIIDFLQGRGRSDVDNVQPMRSDVAAPGGRAKSLLRALPFVR